MNNISVSNWLHDFFRHTTVTSHVLFILPLLTWWFIKAGNGNLLKVLRSTSFILNAFWIVCLIKGILQVPLQGHPSTFALPSGHTYMKMAIIGSLAIEIFRNNRPLGYSLGVIFGLIEGIRTIYYGFHTTPDIIAAVAICFIQMIFFYEFLFKQKHLYYTTVIAGIAMIPTTTLIMKYYVPTYNLGINQASYAGAAILLLVYIREYFLIKKQTDQHRIS